MTFDGLETAISDRRWSANGHRGEMNDFTAPSKGDKSEAPPRLTGDMQRFVMVNRRASKPEWKRPSQRRSRLPVRL
jgi:hypothetical protein